MIKYEKIDYGSFDSFDQKIDESLFFYYSWHTVILLIFMKLQNIGRSEKHMYKGNIGSKMLNLLFVQKHMQSNSIKTILTLTLDSLNR